MAPRRGGGAELGERGEIVSNSVALFCLCFSLNQSRPADRWFGEDKVKHFVASFVATTITAGAARAAGMDANASAWVGAGASTALGVLKELQDRGRPGQVSSARDLVWDLGGTAAGVLLMREVR